nr:hypothetical protein [Angustibacter aerolatus]
MHDGRTLITSVTDPAAPAEEPAHPARARQGLRAAGRDRGRRPGVGRVLRDQARGRRGVLRAGIGLRRDPRRHPGRRGVARPARRDARAAGLRRPADRAGEPPGARRRDGTGVRRARGAPGPADHRRRHGPERAEAGERPRRSRAGDQAHPQHRRPAQQPLRDPARQPGGAHGRRRVRGPGARARADAGARDRERRLLGRARAAARRGPVVRHRDHHRRPAGRPGRRGAGSSGPPTPRLYRAKQRGDRVPLPAVTPS